MNGNLILRTLTSPYNDVTRGSVLSQADVDNNFLFLKGNLIYTADSVSNVVTLKKLNGNDINVTITPKVNHWIENEERILGSDETIVISGDYVLKDTNLYLTTDNVSYQLGSLTFNKYTQIFIGGNLLLVDSNIINDGALSVQGAIVFSGNSTITGTGILN